MIRSIFTDRCGAHKGPAFVSESAVNDWIEDADEHYAEYGRFSHNTPRVGQVFHVTSPGRIMCLECVELAIAETRKGVA